jgi:hypothetical protein
MCTLTYVHIGMGKTASTSIQRNFERQYLDPKKHQINNVLRRYVDTLEYTNEDYGKLKGFLNDNSINFFSSESLISWNPLEWEESIAKLRTLKTPDMRFIFIMRNPVDYVGSLYLQKLHEMCIVDEREYFLKDEEYELKKKFSAHFEHKIFPIQQFKPSELVNLIYKEFPDTYFLRLTSNQDIFSALKNILGISKNFSQVSQNLSFSNRSVKILRFMSGVLKKLNLKFITNVEKRYNKIDDILCFNKNIINEINYVKNNNIINKRSLRNINLRVILRKSDQLFPAKKFEIDKSEIRKILQGEIEFFENEYSEICARIL